MKCSKHTLTVLVLICISMLMSTIVYSKTTKKRRSRRQLSSIKSSTKKLSTNSNNQKLKFTGSWKLKFGGDSVQDEITHGNALGVSASMKINYRFVDSLKLYAEPKVSFASGQAQSLYGEIQPNNSIGVYEGLLNFTPHYTTEFNFGILSHHNKKRVGNEYLLSRASFPGAELKLHIFNINNIKIDFMLEEAIPTSYTMDSGVEEMEKTPRLSIQSIRLFLGDIKNDTLSADVFVTRFQFQNLPSIVAQKSLTRGNTVTNGYNFDYKFAGYSAALGTTYRLNDLVAITGVGTYLKNTEAPEGLNQARMYGGYLTFGVAKGIEVETHINKFYNEPDSAPAYYATFNYGTQNRQGYIYELGFKFNKYNFKVVGNYTNSDLVYKSAFQAKRKAYGFKLETLNVEF